MNTFTIKSFWTYETGRFDKISMKYVDRKVSPVKEKILTVEIDRTDHLDDHGPVLRFIGGPTGFESYYLNDLKLNQASIFNVFVICGGTINSWARCWVKTDDLIDILNKVKED